jgi:hypothetical protein
MYYESLFNKSFWGHIPPRVTTNGTHQKQHYVPYYLSIVFFISQICFWDHKYVFHLGKVFYHLVEVILTFLHPSFLPYVQIY